MNAAATLLLLMLTAVWTGGGRDVTFLLPAAGIAAVALTGLLVCGSGASRQGRRRGSGWWSLVPLVAYMVVHAVNASHRYLPDGDGLDPRAHLVWLPHSVDADATWSCLTYALLLMLAYGLAARFLTQRAQALLLLALIVHGFLLAVTGMLGRPLDARSHTPMGPFVNANNFAAHVNLLVLPAVALAMDARNEARQVGRHPGYLLYFAAACMVASVALAESRAGLAVAGLQLLAWCVVEWRLGAAGKRPRRVIWLLLPIVITVWLTAFLAKDAIRKQVEDSRGSKGEVAVQMRTEAVRGTLAMTADNPVFGVGPGAFARAFPYYQPKALSGYFRYAHNDWLQTAAEFGAVGCALLMLAVACVLAPIWRRRAYLASDAVSRAIVIALGGLGLHACVDFPLQIPAVTLLGAVLAGIVARRLDQYAVASASRAG